MEFEKRSIQLYVLYHNDNGHPQHYLQFALYVYPTKKLKPQATNVIYMEHPFLMFLDHTQRRSTVRRTPLDE